MDAITQPRQIKERPIILKAHEVRGILEGRKNQFRRIIKEDMYGAEFNDFAHWDRPKHVLDRMRARGYFGFSARKYPWGEGSPWAIRCLYGQPGDRLWVRETWAPGDPYHGPYIYKADGHDVVTLLRGWKPSIHMPRWASRITREIVSVRVERLQDISEEDAKADGVRWDGEYWRGGIHPIKGTEKCWGTAKDAYKALWESINGAGSWDTNPWVWVLDVRRAD